MTNYERGIRIRELFEQLSLTQMTLSENNRPIMAEIQTLMDECTHTDNNGRFCYEREADGREFCPFCNKRKGGSD